MLKLKIIAIIILGIFMMSSQLSMAQTMIGFETLKDKVSLERTAWEKDCKCKVGWMEGAERAVVDESQSKSGKKSIKVFYPKGKVGPRINGHQCSLKLKAGTEYYLTYWLRFDKNFSWGSDSSGGKLPGLASDGLCSGGNGCTGTNGFTARYMWREKGRAEIYLYHMDKPGTYGHDFDLKKKNGKVIYFKKNKWIQLTQRVKINSGNNKDGELDVWYNGKKALELKGLRFVNDGSKIDRFYFSTFHGGSGDSWQPQHDCYIWYDDISITSTKPAHLK